MVGLVQCTCFRDFLSQDSNQLKGLMAETLGSGALVLSTRARRLRCRFNSPAGSGRKTTKAARRGFTRATTMVVVS
jgi:2-phospho-L-lactate guanylyltransferase (CobY/MobA/RfbA family)